MMDIAKARLLILSDGRTGGENQSLGVAEMLGFKDPEVITLRPTFRNAILRKLAGLLPVSVAYQDFDGLLKHLRTVDVLMGAGYGTSRVLRACKAAAPNLFTIALMRPAGGAKPYDVVAIPRHDNPPQAENVIATLGNCNRITRDNLAREADRWRVRLQHVRGFRMAVMVGGTSRHAPFSPADATQLIDTLAKTLKAQASNGAGLLVTASRRSGPAVVAALERALTRAEKKHGLTTSFWTPGNPDQRDNPYLAYLALADAVLVTADSSSMVSEAATAGKPVYIWGERARMPKKFRAFYDMLAGQGRLRWWNGQLNLRPPAAPLLDTLLVAGFIRARWQKRFGGGKTAA